MLEGAIRRFREEGEAKPNPLKPEPPQEEGRHART
jgi:hypothetical protein